MANGILKINVTARETAMPVAEARVQIASEGNPDRVIAEAITNGDGIVDDISLDAPPLTYSMEPSDNQPYSEYNIKIDADGFDGQIVSGVQIFEGEKAIQNIPLGSLGTENDTYNPSVIGAHTLWEDYPPKIAENEIKPVAETGEIVLSRVVIPETIVVHDGAPSDKTATDYYVSYKDYIKNVASNEIYSTWSDACLRANILAIMSFALNRVYTEWYRNIW